jgi:Leucine-rich repeat (LRR) protein
MLPNSFGNLVNLEHLELKSCSEMMSLPDSIGNLTKLQYIELSECKKLQMLPCSFGNLVQLQHLYLDKCNKLAVSKKDFGNIRALERLKISGCSRIKVLPPQVASNQSLRELILRDTRIKELPSDIGELIHLEVLIFGSELLTKLPASFGSLGSLQRLELLRSQLKRLPKSIGDLRSLKQLRIQSLKGLESLPNSIGYLTSLEELVISNCSELKCLPDSIRLLTRLRELKIGQSGVEYSPPSVMELNNFERLEIEDCGLNEMLFRKDGGERTLTDSMSSKLDISNVKCMPGHKYLKLRAIRISEVSFREGVCPNLQYLNIKDCHCLVEVGPLPATLIELVLWNCVALSKIGLSGLAKLEGVKDSRSWKRLNVSGCPKAPVGWGSNEAAAPTIDKRPYPMKK